MRLYFLRHSLAGKGTEWQGDDAQRPLTKPGKKRMAREAAYLAKLELELDRLISSPLLRACQTAEIVAAELGMEEKLVTDERLSPGFNAAQLAALLRDHSQSAAIMLVGHEPDFSQTIGELTGGGRVVLKKGGLACVDLPDPATLQGDLVWLIPPGMLAG